MFGQQQSTPFGSPAGGGFGQQNAAPGGFGTPAPSGFGAAPASGGFGKLLFVLRQVADSLIV
jgi:hypothetical protein